MGWKFIKDPIHNYIRINETDLKIIDTDCFQRLRNIFHLGTGYLTYPGATHSRLEHSLGVMQLGSSVIDNVITNSTEDGMDWWSKLKKDEIDIMKKELRYACLLHDIGHTPFSHTCEQFLDEDMPSLVDELITKYNFKLITKANENIKSVLGGAGKHQHELLSCYITLARYKQVLEKEIGVNPQRVAAMIIGRVSTDVPKEHETYYEVLANILNSSIDVDKLDYILRDNYMSGALLTILDRDRMVATYNVSKNNTLLLSSKALSLVSNLINARHLMYMWIYQHHKVVYTDGLLRKIINCWLDTESDPDKRVEMRKKLFSKEAVLNLIDDYNVIAEIRNCKNAELVKLYKSFISHQFLKSCWKHAFEFQSKIESCVVRGDLQTDIKARPRKIEEYISKELNIDKMDVLSSYANFSPFSPASGLDITIEVDGIPKYAVQELGLHPDKEKYYCEVPYVYVPEAQKDHCVDLLQNFTSNSIT